MKKRIKNNQENYNPILILLRFIFILVLILLLDYIYIIFTPLTVTPVAILLKIIYPGILVSSNLIINNDKAILLIPACIAGSAYLLIFILNLSVKMKPVKRKGINVFVPKKEIGTICEQFGIRKNNFYKKKKEFLQILKEYFKSNPEYNYHTRAILSGIDDFLR